MARAVDKLYDSTSTSGGALDTGALNTASYNEGLIIHCISAGAAAPTGYTASMLDDSGASVLAKTLTAPGIAGVTLDSWCAGGTINSPGPDQSRFQVTAGAASTVRLIVHGVKSGIGV